MRDMEKQMKDLVDEYLQMIQDCENNEGRLTDWERNFVDSIKSQFLNGNPMSVKQVNTLDSIWDKVTSRG